jgi:hypothetical protein
VADFFDIFLHIAKTGGTTLEYIMRRHYGDAQVYLASVRERNTTDGRGITINSAMEEILKIRSDLDGFSNHYRAIISLAPYGIHELVRRPVRYFTMLRDPVERCISAWFFILARGPRHPMYKVLEECDFNFAKLIETRKSFLFHNDQTRLILGTEEFTLSASHLVTAQDRLRTGFIFAGALERIQESISEIARRLDWGNVSIGHENKTPNKRSSSLDKKVRDLLMDANPLDRQLHRWVLQNVS